MTMEYLKTPCLFTIRHWALHFFVTSSDIQQEITELAGYTSRVSTLLDVMDNIQHGRFEKKLIAEAESKGEDAIIRGRGTVVESEDIEFIDVPVCSPNGVVLVKALSFSIKRGDHLLSESAVYVYGEMLTYPSCGTQRMRKILPIPHTRWSMACVRWHSAETSIYRYLLHTPASLSQPRFPETTNHLPGFPPYHAV
jgi:hypothetical protein